MTSEYDALINSFNNTTLHDHHYDTPAMFDRRCNLARLRFECAIAECDIATIVDMCACGYQPSRHDLERAAAQSDVSTIAVLCLRVAERPSRALYNAVARDYAPAISMLCDSGCRITARVLKLAVARGNPDIVEYLCRRRGDVPPSVLNAAICGYYANGHRIDLIAMLLRYTNNKRTLLDHSVVSDNIALVRVLHSGGCPITQRSLATAVKNRHVHLIDYLCANGCIPSIRSMKIAIALGDIETVVALCRNNPQLISYAHTRSLAQSRDHIANYLESEGIRSN